jgi:hypothetical protein
MPRDRNGEARTERLEELEQAAQNPAVWNNHQGNAKKS